MHIDSRNAVVAPLVRSVGADLLEINDAAQQKDKSQFSRETLFAFCLANNLWLKIIKQPDGGRRYHALDTRAILALLNGSPTAVRVTEQELLKGTQP